MQNPYTGIEMRHEAPPMRLGWDYAFVGVAIVGVAYIAIHFALVATLGNAMIASTAMVTLLYFQLGGYGFTRARRQRLLGRSGANREIAAIVAVVAAWDTGSAFLLAPDSPAMVFTHLAGGLVALVLAVTAFWHARDDAAMVAAPQH